MRTRLLSTLALLLSLPATASITGVVINPDGQPIGSAKVSIFAPETTEGRRLRLLSKTPERPPLATKQTDSKGTFVFDSPKDQPVVDLRVDASGFAPEATRLLADDDAGAIALTTAAMQRGTITANGKPVAGATVVWMGNSTDFLATTDADGHYTVPDPAMWANRLVIVHPDYALFEEVSGFRSRPKGVDRTLMSGVAITGRVIAADGQTAVAKAPLLIDHWPLGVTADDGTFAIGHAPKDWQELETTSGNFGGVRARGSDAAMTVRLTKLAKISGTVRDTKTQIPVANAEVRLGPTMPGLGRIVGVGAIADAHSVFTDVKGAFSITTLPGRYSLYAVYPNSAISNANVSITAGQTVNKALFAIPLARVSGVVVDEDKRGVAAARVAARNASRDTPLTIAPGMGRFRQDATAFSGPDGRFVLRNLATETDLQIDAAKKGFPTGRSASVRLNPGERKSGVVIIIPRGVALTGKVTDGDGRPLSGVGVEPVESADGGRGFGIRRMVMNMMRDRDADLIRTGSDGSFTLRVKEGTYDVIFKREGFATKTLRAQSVSASSRPVEVKLDPGVEISGRVVRGGAGMEGVMVNVIGSQEEMANTTTASDGSFTLSDLTPGQMMLAVVKPDAFVQQVRPVTAPARNLVIELPAGGRITGRVVDKADKSPVTSFQAGISLARSSGGMAFAGPPMLKAFTTDDGTFTLENVPPGPTQLVISAPGYTTARVSGLNVEDGKTLRDVEVALETGVRLTGRVTGPDGSPLAGVSIREAGVNFGPARFMTGLESGGMTDPNGEYTIEAVDPGQKTFTFTRQGYLTEERSINLSGKDARLDVQLSSGVTLTGVVTTDSGVPVADASVNAMSASDSTFGRQGQTDGNGNFQIAGLAPGHYTIVAAKPGLTNGILRDFDVAAGTPARVIMKSGGTIMGHVSGLTNTELQHTTVTAASANGNASAEVDASGSYRIDGAPTGTVRVSARTGQGFVLGGKTSPVQSVQIDPGASVQVDLQFKSSTVIRGRVTRNGQPLGSAIVAFMPRNAQSQTSASGTTDGNGSYEISGLDDGSYNVSVVDMDRSGNYTSTYDVHGSSSFDIDIRTATLRGRVIDTSSGSPLADARVQLSSGQGPLSSRVAQTDPSGSFTIENLARGSYQVTAEKDGYGHDIRNLVIGDSAPDDLEFKLFPSDGVTLQVVDARDSRQLAANVLRIVDGQGRDVPSAGGFRFNSIPGPVKLTLAAGSYTVTLSAMGYAPRVITVTSPSTQTVQMSPGGTLVLRAKSSASQRVRLLDPNGATYPRGQNGIFQIDLSPLSTTLNNIAAGSYTLQVLDSADRVLNTVPVTVVDGQQAVVDV